ncbi:MAG: alpha/beta hydrolase [Xanthobacteraceae bacterium]
MVSLRAELMRIGIRWGIKRRSLHQSAEESRKQLRAMERLTPRPPATTRTVAVLAGGVKADLVTVPGSKPHRHVLYFHGGAYRAGSASNYRHFTWRIAAAAQAALLVIDYRLAPEHPFPAALEDAVSSYRWLLASGTSAANTVFMGDSAGGGLTLAALLKARDEGLALPAAAVVLSPWTDLALTGESLTRNANSDPMLNAVHLPRLAGEYLAGADPHLPYASPLYGDLGGLPPLLIQVGGDEILLDDAVRFHKKMEDAGCKAELEIWPRMPHVWHLFAPAIPEARRAIQTIGGFVMRHTPDDSRAA